MDIDLLSKISETEYEMLSKYRDWYANDSALAHNRMVSIRDILSAAWAKNNMVLYKLLGENLILSKEFVYEKSSDELVNELELMIDDHRGYGRENRKGWKFIRNFSSWYREKYKIPEAHWTPYFRYEYDSEEDEALAEKNSFIQNGLSELINYWTLAENKYSGDPFIIELKDGKKYTVSSGCKPMKALAKIAEAYDIEDFEDFRICHSLIHNQKKIKGIINLSIHPLDYWTMSDNECDWSSCMSWQEPGGYRQGTVEMMNSPIVIVAYMSAANPMTIGNGFTWNNKKWRQLFIVDRDIILGIKSYPYYNDELTLTITKWIKELAETNMGWQYFGEENGMPIKYNFNPFHNPDYPDEERLLRFAFFSNNMYTDVGCMDWHPMYVGTHVHYDCGLGYNQRYYDNKPTYQIDINYSGESQCVWCGNTDPGLDDESCLCCDVCQDSIRCCECGERLYDDGYYIDGDQLCEDCYERFTRECFVCEDSHYKDNMKEIFVKLPISEEEKQRIINQRHNYDVHLTDMEDSNYETWCFLNEPIYICIDETKQFEELYLCDNAKIKIYDEFSYWGSRYYINAEKLNMKQIDKLSEVIPYEVLTILKKAKTENDYNEIVSDYDYYIKIRSAMDLDFN